ncbi:MAG: hypothetical protein MUF81_20710 [Verrucomicrobia bacterium]|jgi:hypothetical protein|nr:hypothetical protein [Verrucomicrobiota bacterium]
MMDSDEREIYFYLKSWKQEFISSREICRRAGGKKRFRQEEEWAKPVLLRMAEKGILETDSGGHYRIKPMDMKMLRKGKRWVSPQVARILKESGKDFNSVLIDDAEMDRYYESL